MNWKRFLRRDAADAEQQEELEFYVDVTAEEYVERGMNPEAAREAARRKLGNATLVREEIYGMNTITFAANALRTARHTVRLVRTHPGFVLTVVLSLALGIGANTAIFSVVHGVLIQPLPYPHADALVGIYNRLTLSGQIYEEASLSPGMYAACRNDCRAFEHFGVWTSGAATVTGVGEPEQITTAMVTQGVLPAFSVPPSLGRWFSPEDDSPGGARTAILSHGYWQRRFGGDREILGRTVAIDFVPHQIVGVMPRDFRFVDLSPDLFLAQRMTTNRPDEFSYNGIGQAETRPRCGCRRTRTSLASGRIGLGTQGVGKLLEELTVTPNARPLKNDVVGNVGMALRVLMGALGLLMLLVCANVANLVLVRAQARQQEFAIRAALGAGWGRIAWEQLTESLTLGLMGGTLGLGLAYVGVRLLVANGPAGLPRLDEITLGPAGVAFALLCALVTSLLFGTVAIFSRRVPRRIGNARGATPAREQLRGQRVLVVGQVAMALVLLVASGLMVRTLLAIESVKPGFTRPEQIQMVRISLPQVLAREPEWVIRLQKDILDRLAAIPEVAAIGFASALPLENNRNGVVVAVEGVTEPERMPPNRRYRHASPGLFAAQGSRLLAGRDFTWDDVFDQRRVAIVSENMARESWGEPRQALGKRIRIGRDGPWTEVVGVVENIHADGLHQPAPATVYARAGVETAANGSTAVTTRGDAGDSKPPSGQPDVSQGSGGGGLRGQRECASGRRSHARRRLPALHGADLVHGHAHRHRRGDGLGARRRWHLRSTCLRGGQAAARSQHPSGVGRATWRGTRSLRSTRSTTHVARGHSGTRFFSGSFALDLVAALWCDSFGSCSRMHSQAAALVAGAIVASVVPARRAASVDPIETLRIE